MRTTTMSGVVTDAELFDAAAAVVGDPRFSPDHRALVDLTAVERAAVTHGGLENVARLLAGAIDGQAEHPRVAVVAPASPELRALVAHYAQYAATARVPYEYRVFASVDEARGWLRTE